MKLKIVTFYIGYTLGIQVVGLLQGKRWSVNGGEEPLQYLDFSS